MERYRDRIITRLDQQRAKGIRKYGASLESNTWNILETLEHLAQELTDGLEYIESLKEKFEQVYSDIGTSKQQGQAPEVRKCDYTSKECANKRCEFDLAYKAECRDNYFCHHRGEKATKCLLNSCGAYSLSAHDGCAFVTDIAIDCMKNGNKRYVPKEDK